MERLERIFQVICTPIKDDGSSGEDFILGTYATQEFANEQKEVCEAEAYQEKFLAEYRVDEHAVLYKG